MNFGTANQNPALFITISGMPPLRTREDSVVLEEQDMDMVVLEPPDWDMDRPWSSRCRIWKCRSLEDTVVLAMGGNGFSVDWVMPDMVIRKYL
ncbi:hypothetical protein AVEN_69441-1 [Araneus ventricosus]|uniref:Uncharacterized protein n=1 Tax=Araneus ventricosus TaxID=182803 RepID=A0A4Y2K4F4_ARAVE|nr:hypothetical protein AVEN_69441-1 [Araneus ventricosus]